MKETDHAPAESLPAPAPAISPALDIYVMSHCENCRYALEVAAWIAQNYPQVRVQVIDVAATSAPLPESVVATPTYLLDGKRWMWGNPSQAEIEAALGPVGR
jgi:hypothetical protein